MSFLKITDANERDFIVQEFLNTKRNIQNNSLKERVATRESKQDLEKFFKPVTDSQKELIKEIVHEPKAITYHNIPNIEYHEEQPQDTNIDIGPIAAQYLRKFTSKEGVDKTYGLYDKHGNFYIGDKMVQILDNNLIIDDKDYQGTPGLWELLVSKTPSDEIYTDEDYNNYKQIIHDTNTIRMGNNPNSSKPKASKSWKWKNIMKEIWDNRDEFEGSSIILPSDPNALLERFDLLMASKGAGNTGVQNELVSIGDELRRQKVFDKNQYKNVMLCI